jgi:hypothetical protein
MRDQALCACCPPLAGQGAAEVTATEAPADVKKEQPVASPDQPVPPATVEPYQLDVPEGIPCDTDTEDNRAALAGFTPGRCPARSHPGACRLHRVKGDSHHG